MDEDKGRILFNSYFLSQFHYCPLIWMNHSKSINKKINNFHERALRFIYCDHSNNFQYLLQTGNSVTIYQYCTYYSIRLFSFSIVNYNLRSGTQFHQPSANTIWNGQETISYLEPRLIFYC